MVTTTNSLHIKAQSGSSWCTVKWFILVVIVILGGGMISFVHGKTIIDAWTPIGISLVAASLLGSRLWRMWRWITSTESFVLNYLCNLVVLTVMILLMFYGANYMGADPSSRHTEQVTIEHRHTEVRHHTKRVGRRSTGQGQGQAYNVYYVTVRFAEGGCKELQVNRTQFNRMRPGSTVSLTVAQGLLGIPVITDRWKTR